MANTVFWICNPSKCDSGPYYSVLAAAKELDKRCHATRKKPNWFRRADGYCVYRRQKKTYLFGTWLIIPDGLMPEHHFVKNEHNCWVFDPTKEYSDEPTQNEPGGGAR
jgi:hypothetical protein